MNNIAANLVLEVWHWSIFGSVRIIKRIDDIECDDRKCVGEYIRTCCWRDEELVTADEQWTNCGRNFGFCIIIS